MPLNLKLSVEVPAGSLVGAASSFWSLDSGCVGYYRKAVQKARDKYVNRYHRFGYTTTYFSSLRHSYCDYPALQELQEAMLGCEKRWDAEETLMEHLCNAKGGFNNHSFKTYLLDELLRYQRKGNLPDNIDWKCYHKRPVIWYQGRLFRGDMRAPKEIFEYGFQLLNGKEPSIKKCIANYTGRNGVSTSMSYEVAHVYANYTRCCGEWVDVCKGYVYEINYRGYDGIDVAETLYERSGIWPPSNICNGVSWFFGGVKHEVIVVNKGIKPADIVKCWDFHDGDGRGRPVVRKNPNYQPERPGSPVEPDCFSEMASPPQSPNAL